VSHGERIHDGEEHLGVIQDAVESRSARTGGSERDVFYCIHAVRLRVVEIAEL
jgi:hypothetical protein